MLIRMNSHVVNFLFPLINAETAMKAASKIGIKVIMWIMVAARLFDYLFSLALSFSCPMVLPKALCLDIICLSGKSLGAGSCFFLWME